MGSPACTGLKEQKRLIPPHCPKKTKAVETASLPKETIVLEKTASHENRRFKDPSQFERLKRYKTPLLTVTSYIRGRNVFKPLTALHGRHIYIYTCEPLFQCVFAYM